LVNLRNSWGVNTCFSGIVTSQYILYYCTYYSVSLTCTIIHCTIDIHTLYVPYMFLVSLCPVLKLHLQHLFTTLVHTLSHSHSVALHLAKLSHTRLVVSACWHPIIWASHNIDIRYIPFWFS
jgi:hypothetical protein